MSAAPQSFAGISVPEGEPDGLRSAAGRFGGLAGTLSGVSTELRGIPASMSTWLGPASVAFAGSCQSTGFSAEGAVVALSTAEQAARSYADALEEAQREAERAIDRARDAQERIDRAEREIAAAQTAQATAHVAAAAASTELLVTSLAGTPSPTAEATHARAEGEAAAAAADEVRARRALEDAQEDLRRAQERGRDAEEAARDAGSAAAAAFGGAGQASPVYTVLGGQASASPGTGTAPAGVSWWNTVNEGNPNWNEDQFASQLVPFHPKNDALGEGKWYLDQTSGFGTAMVGAAVGQRAAALRRLAGTAILTTTTTTTFLHVRTPTRSLTVASRTVTQATSRPWASLGPTAARYGRVGKAIPVAGIVIGFGSASLDQWRNDASNPSLSTTDRVGRADGVGAYVTGAAAAGAVVGTFIPIPGVGTVGGAAVGALVGLGAGAAASAWEPGKELAADIGQGISNGAVGAYNLADEGLQAAERKIDEGIAAGQEWAGDRLDGLTTGVRNFDPPDIDMPDVDLPDVDLPDVDLPDVDLPDVDLPDVDLPDLNPL